MRVNGLSSCIYIFKEILDYFYVTHYMEEYI